MPRSLIEVLAHADDIADEFESYQPRDADCRPAEPLFAARLAVAQRAQAERDLLAAIGAMRAAGYSWSTVGAAVGTSGQAARQRYGSLIEPGAPAPDGPRRRRVRTTATTNLAGKKLRGSATVGRSTGTPGTGRSTKTPGAKTAAPPDGDHTGG